MNDYAVAHRDIPLELAALLIADTRIRVMDCETTGLDTSTAGVCEVAAVDLVPQPMGKPFFIEPIGSMLFNPGHPIPATASAIHHITDEHVAEAPGYSPGVWAATDGVYAAHNAPYDEAMLKLPGVWLDTERLAKHLWPDLPSHGNQVVRYALKLRPPVEAGAPAHRALNDALVTAAIMVEALSLVHQKWPGVRTIGELAATIAAPVLLKVVPFRSANGVTFEEADIGLLDWIVDRGAGGPDVVFSAEHWLRERCGAPVRAGDDGDEDDDGRPF